MTARATGSYDLAIAEMRKEHVGQGALIDSMRIEWAA